MNDASKQKPDRGRLEIDTEECKGCGLCIEACPPKVIGMNERLNCFGYRTAVYAGGGCTGCGICFMVCPEPGAITVLRRVSAAPTLSAENAERMGHPGSVEGATECASN